MANLDGNNPFNRVKKVMKTAAERRARDPIRLFIGNQRQQQLARA